MTPSDRPEDVRPAALAVLMYHCEACNPPPELLDAARVILADRDRWQERAEALMVDRDRLLHALNTLRIDAHQHGGCDDAIEAADAAPIIRNGTIVDNCDSLTAFRSAGKSNGTDDVIAKARKAGKLRTVYGPDGEVVETHGSEGSK